MVRMTLVDSGVVIVVETQPERRHTAQSMADDVVAFQRLTGNQKLPVLWDVRRMGRPTPEGWRELVSRLPDVVAAMAFLVDQESRTVPLTFPQVMNATLFPSRVFVDVDEAMAWAEQFVPDDFSSAHLD
jgi:hypothetical protein